MRENRTYGSEGGESGSTGLPYPYHAAAASRLKKRNFKTRERGTLVFVFHCVRSKCVDRSVVVICVLIWLVVSLAGATG